MELSKNEKILKTTALIYTAMFIITMLVFIFLPGMLLHIINSVSQAAVPSLPAAADSGKFWLSMTVSMMAGVTILSFLIYRDVKKNMVMVIPLVFMKFTSALTGLSFFIIGLCEPSTGWNTLANLIIFTTDFPLGLLMLYLYRRVKKER